MNSYSVKVSHASVRYNLVEERPRTLQEFLINIARGRRYQKREFWALRDVTFEVPRGGSLGIIGSNGAGKSTLLKVISGVITPTEGHVTVAGRIAPMIELGAGFDYELTGRENIYLNGSLLGLKKREIDNKFHNIIDFSELKDFLYSPLKSYSSGMVARLAFSIAVEVDAEILLVDEVLSVGDEGFKKKCHERIDAVIKRGVSLLFVSHNMGEVQRLCKDAIWIDHGQVVEAGEAESVSRKYLVFHDKRAFEDIPEGHPLRQYVDAVFLRGIMSGYAVGGKRYFNPDNKMTRATFAVVLSNALGMRKPDRSGKIYADVSETHWTAGYINWLYGKGLMQGIEDRQGYRFFHPDDYVTTMDLREILSRIDSTKCAEVLSGNDVRVLTRGDIATMICKFFGYTKDLSRLGDPKVAE